MPAPLKAEGLSILVVDKNIADLTRLADRHYVIEKGRVVWSGLQANCQNQPGRAGTLSGRDDGQNTGVRGCCPGRRALG